MSSDASLADQHQHRVGGARRQLHPASDEEIAALDAYSTQGLEAFLEGHQQAFEVLGGTPTGKIRHDILKSAVWRDQL